MERCCQMTNRYKRYNLLYDTQGSTNILLLVDDLEFQMAIKVNEKGPMELYTLTFFKGNFRVPLNLVEPYVLHDK